MVNETILIAEGCDCKAGTVAESLRNCGHRVIIATDGEEAMHRAIAESPGLVIVDANASAKDGYCICRNLKKCPETREIKVLLLQADNGCKQAETPARWHQEADKILEYPVNGDKLTDTVAHLI